MGIAIEFNPDLALRNWSEHKKGKRRKEECIPEKLVVGETYDFFKMGQRNYFLEGEVPLVETKGNQELSRPVAGIIILEETHVLHNGVPCTKGKYKVVEVFDPKDKTIHFEGFMKRK